MSLFSQSSISEVDFLTLRSEFVINIKSLKTAGEAFRSPWILLILACMNLVLPLRDKI